MILKGKRILIAIGIRFSLEDFFRALKSIRETENGGSPPLVTFGGLFLFTSRRRALFHHKSSTLKPSILMNNPRSI